MARPRELAESWFDKAANLVVRNGISLRQAALECDMHLSIEEADLISKRRNWQEALWTARHSFASEIANNPSNSKESLIGTLQLLAQKLIEDSQLDKAAKVLMDVGKLRGYDKSGDFYIFGSVTAKDLEEERQKLTAQLAKEEGTPGKPN